MHASFPKLMFLMKSLCRRCFKSFLKFFKEVACLRQVGVVAHAIGPLYLIEFLPVSKLNLGRAK